MNQIIQTEQNRQHTSHVLAVLNIFLRETFHSDIQKITFQALFIYLYQVDNRFLPLDYDFLRLQLVRLEKRLKEVGLPELPSNRLIKDRLTSLFDHHLLIGILFFERAYKKNSPPLLRLIPHVDIILDRAYQHQNFAQSPYEILEQVACSYVQELFKTATPQSEEEIQEKKKQDKWAYVYSLIEKLHSLPPGSEEHKNVFFTLSTLSKKYHLGQSQSLKSAQNCQDFFETIDDALLVDTAARQSASNSVEHPSDYPKKRDTGGGDSSLSSSQIAPNSENLSPSFSEVSGDRFTPKIDPVSETAKMDETRTELLYGRAYSNSVRVFSQNVDKNVTYIETEEKIRTKIDTYKEDCIQKYPKLNTDKISNNTHQKEGEEMVEVFEKMGVEKFQLTLYKPIGFYPNGKEEKVAEDNFEYSPQELKKELPNLEKRNETGLNLGIHPVLPKDSKFKLILLDDLTKEFFEKLKKYGFWGQQTSEKSFHLWLEIEGDNENQFQSIKRRLKAKYGGDPSASYSKICGSLNWKLKYGSNPPRIQKMEVDAENWVTNEAELLADGIIEKEEEEKKVNPPPCVSKREKGFGERKKWPDYRISLAGAPLKEDGTPDRSAADFRWCLYAIKTLGWTDENEVARKLMEVSQRATDGGWNYAIYTAREAFTKYG